jgi:hypothetical protein
MINYNDCREFVLGREIVFSRSFYDVLTLLPRLIFVMRDKRLVQYEVHELPEHILRSLSYQFGSRLLSTCSVKSAFFLPTDLNKIGLQFKEKQRLKSEQKSYYKHLELLEQSYQVQTKSEIDVTKNNKVTKKTEDKYEFEDIALFLYLSYQNIEQRGFNEYLKFIQRYRIANQFKVQSLSTILRRFYLENDEIVIVLEQEIEKYSVEK